MFPVRSPCTNKPMIATDDCRGLSFQPALQLALEGFEVSPRLADMLGRMASFTRLDENSAAEHFYPRGKPLEAGQLRKNPDYAKTLAVLAENGPSAFYTGSIAKAIVAAAQARARAGAFDPHRPQNYAPTTRSVICGPFKAVSICSASPPSSGGAQIMIARLYEHLLAQSETADKMQAFVDAQRWPMPTAIDILRIPTTSMCP